MHTRSLAPAALVLALLAPACDVKVGEGGNLSFDIAEGRAEDEWSRTYTLAPGGRLEVVGLFGSIEAYPTEGTTVEVAAKRTLWGRSLEEAQAELKTLQMIEETAPDRVRVQTPPTPEGSHLRKSVDYRVGVPAGLVVLFKTENGSITVKDVTGQLTAQTTNGGLTLNGLAGPLDASTVNGGINAELAPLDGDVKLGAVNGGIRFSVPPTIDADLEATTVNGGVSVDDDLKMTVTQKDRTQMRGRFNKGGRKISAQVVNGGVRVSEPRQP